MGKDESIVQFFNKNGRSFGIEVITLPLIKILEFWKLKSKATILVGW